MDKIIEGLVEGKKNRYELKKYLSIYNKKYGGLDNFRKAFIEQVATTGNIGNFKHIDGLRTIHFDISSQECQSEGYDKLYEDIVGENDNNKSFRMINSKKIDAALESVLNDRERKMMELKYGLNGQKRISNESIGKIYGISREAVRKAELRTIKKLRNYQKEHNDFIVNLNEKRREEFLKTYFDTYDIVAGHTRKPVEKNLKLILEGIVLIPGRDQLKKVEKNEKTIKTPLEELGLNQKTYNALRRSDFTNIEELTSMRIRDIKNIKGIGRQNYKEIEKKVHEYGLNFQDEEKMDVLQSALEVTKKKTRSGAINTQLEKIMNIQIKREENGKESK